MGGPYIGKTNKELIIEVIGKVENIQKELSECRPVCFASKGKIAVIEQKQADLKYVIAIAATLTTAAVNILVWFFKKLKGG